MPRYRALSLLFVDGARIKPGQEFNSDSPPSDQWFLLETHKVSGKSKGESEPVRATAGPVDPFADFSDDKLRDFIETKSRNKKRPAEDMVREKLLEIAQRLAKPDGEQ